MQNWDLKQLDVIAHAPKVLTSSEDARAIALTLPAGEKLREHQVEERAFVVVIDGEVEVTLESEAGTRGPTGSLFEFDPRERHEVTALSDARLLLVLAPWRPEERR